MIVSRLLNNRVFHNSIFLMIFHVVGYLIPVAEMSILGRALGPDGYGSLVFSFSIIILMSVFVEFGFNLTGTREVSQIKSDARAVMRLVCDVFFAKLLIFIVILTMFVLAYSVFLVEKIPVEYLLPLLIYFLGLAFSPFWFFHGMDVMLGPIVLNLAFRFVSLAFLWFFVESQGDLLLALYIMAFSGFINTVLTIVWMVLKLDRSCKAEFSFRSSLYAIKKSFSAFLYKSASDLSASGAPVILGAVTSDLQAGYYAPVDKLVRSATGLAGPVLSAFYPYLSRQDKYVAIRSGVIISSSFLLAGILGAFLLMQIGGGLVKFIVGNEFSGSEALVSLFAFLIPIRMLNHSIGMSILLPVREEIVGARLLIGTSFFSLMLGGYLASISGAYGMIQAQLIVESFLSVLLVCYVAYILRSVSS